MPEINFRDFLNLFDVHNMPAAANAPQSIMQQIPAVTNQEGW